MEMIKRRGLFKTKNLRLLGNEILSFNFSFGAAVSFSILKRIYSEKIT
jgi:hypothetical protein